MPILEPFRPFLPPDARPGAIHLFGSTYHVVVGDSGWGDEDEVGFFDDRSIATVPIATLATPTRRYWPWVKVRHHWWNDGKGNGPLKAVSAPPVDYRAFYASAFEPNHLYPEAIKPGHAVTMPGSNELHLIIAEDTLHIYTVRIRDKKPSWFLRVHTIAREEFDHLLDNGA